MRRLILALAGMAALPASAATSTYDDLAAVIALNNLPCGYVTAFEKKGENDWIAHCANHVAYHVYLDQTGRVRVEKR
jgi:hypothetical protein